MFSEFEDYMTYLEIEKGRAENTLRTRERSLSDFSEWCEENGITNVEDVGSRDIASYVEYLVDVGYAQNTIINSKYTSISAAYNYLYERRIIDDNPIDRVKRQSMKKKARQGMSRDEKKNKLGAKDHLTKEEVYELAENAPDPTDRNELLIKLMFWTGCRVSEIVGVTLDSDGMLDGEGCDIEPEKPTIKVFSPKTDDPRWVSYPRSEINPLLRDWVSHGRLRYKYADETDRLFIGPQGPLTESGIGRVIDEAAKNIDIQEPKREAKDGRQYKRVTPHLLRHSHAMHYHNEQGVALDTLKDHLGHTSVGTTERFYAEGTEEKMVSTFGE